ncbi:hypothetical protein M427DRAFT_55347 [Gonapodya prolifera JEL478]|uniref:DUF4436 domain-containing protein n=1 Tax=Gonapodya prolifera (strain JEL478) TaxID=1344416 RepID=A0A139AJR8_GONPJ|nr:hypothetical protein M427DRAFT_55347 [Gonapodya prolifera JEL478]|eukprot:KXS16723.1 hypothetical protein M427DRAFT_55347 [Gonapodya prolifera JEL478]
MALRVPLWRRFMPLVLLVILAIVVGVTNWAYQKYSVQPKKAEQDCYVDGACQSANGTQFIQGHLAEYPDGLGIAASFSTIDTQSGKITYRFAINALGKFSGNLGNVTLYAADTIKKFDVTSLLPSLDVVVSGDGDPSTYPFDKYEAAFIVFAADGPVNSATSKSIPLGFNFYGLVGSYYANADVLQILNEADGQFFYQVTLTVGRSVTTRFFSIVTGIIMWGLTLAYGLVSTDIRYKGRKLEVPFVALGAALLFALPNIRNAAPNTPPIGTQMDMATLFFAIVVIGGCLIVNIFRAVYEYAPPAAKPAEKSPDLPKFGNMAPGKFAEQPSRYGAEELVPIITADAPIMR